MKTPEARRQVVAQIIDYTQHIVRWDFSKLNASFADYAKQAGINQQGLAGYVAEQCDDDFDEAAFTNAVGRCLRYGRLLLLNVGDGIREGVAEMTAYLQNAPSLQFTLGLVELGCYRVSADSQDATTHCKRTSRRRSCPYGWSSPSATSRRRFSISALAAPSPSIGGSRDDSPNVVFQGGSLSGF